MMLRIFTVFFQSGECLLVFNLVVVSPEYNEIYSLYLLPG